MKAFAVWCVATAAILATCLLIKDPEGRGKLVVIGGLLVIASTFIYRVVRTK